MPKVSFKVFIFLSLVVIIFLPIFFAKTVSSLMNYFSTEENHTDDLNLWMQENILDVSETQFSNEKWKKQLIAKAEEDKIDLLIIFENGELLQTKGMSEPEDTLMIESDRTHLENFYEHYYFALDHYNIYADGSLLASVYVSYPRPAEEQLKSMNYDFIIYISAFSLVAILIILSLQVNLMKPLRSINESSQLISNGTYNINLPESNIKEMNFTTHAFIEMAKKLKLSKKNNERLEDERKLFVSSIVHDLRTPIFSLRGFLEGLMKGIVTNEQKKKQYVEMSMKQANHLNELVTSLANYANIEGQITLEEMTVFQINEVISDLKQMLLFNLSEKDLTIKVHNFTSESITGDYVLLRRAFENMLINCIRHSPEKGIIEVFIKEREGFIETIIQDNGKGFAEKDLQHIFKPLYKGETEKFGSSQRMGLGLTIAQVIVEKHSGIVHASNDFEKGAKILVKIPKNNDNGINS
ncbi:sensor histidine kinase [Pseudogracilibacillus auburnensis]|uniref:sensor histidine kinase n=1 Tax=Pseudogracilibacillus auburnensis TaxID=1494959 RepID=UPI001A958124|nr:HAMP domain-containing sensor histidine kinase [Pseudogracilibacillus auburnensis]MBO1001244.1 HAMP domain-containing histidine kinase [Pseudogracilibacillus auburnensis]